MLTSDMVKLIRFLFWICLVPNSIGTREPEPWFGDFVGTLPDPKTVGIFGKVFIVNSTCLQILNFTYNGKAAPDLFFWLDSEPVPSPRGVKLATFESGEKPLVQYIDKSVVLLLPSNAAISDFATFGLWCQSCSQDFGHLKLPDHLNPPTAQFLEGGLRASSKGLRYNVGSGPILIMDRRTVKIYGLTFDGNRAPDSFFFVGKGPEPRRSDGVKVPIRGKDTADQISSLKESYHGDKDLILELPPTHDIYHIDWISLYCYRFAVNFAHAWVHNVSDRIPPYVRAPKQALRVVTAKREPWTPVTLLGKPPRTTFTFQLGPPGGSRAYEALAKAKPGEFVWYVNGYMAPEIWVQRGVTYTIRVEGGNDPRLERFYNPLYISDEPYGGFQKLVDEDKHQITVFAGLNKQSSSHDGGDSETENSAGRLCRFINRSPGRNPDDFQNFEEFRQQLTLRCLKGETAVFQWTPDERTPDVVYYQSYSNFNMGWKIIVTDEIPLDLPFTEKEPYNYELLDTYEEDVYNKLKGKYSTGDSSRANAHLSVTFCLTVTLVALLYKLY